MEPGWAGDRRDKILKHSLLIYEPRPLLPTPSVPPLFPLLQFPTWHGFEAHGMHSESGPAWLHCVASLYLAGQLNFCFGIFLFVFIVFARSRSATYKSKQAAVVWRNTHSLAKECISELVYCYGFGYVGTHFATPGVRVWFCMRARVYTDRSMWRNIH